MATDTTIHRPPNELWGVGSDPMDLCQDPNCSICNPKPKPKFKKSRRSNKKVSPAKKSRRSGKKVRSAMKSRRSDKKVRSTMKKL
jgi:hypothetical protein